MKDGITKIMITDGNIYFYAPYAPINLCKIQVKWLSAASLPFSVSLTVLNAFLRHTSSSSSSFFSSYIALESNANSRLLSRLLPISSVVCPLFLVFNFAFINNYPSPYRSP